MIVAFFLSLVLPALLLCVGRRLSLALFVLCLLCQPAWATAPITTVTGSIVVTAAWQASQTQSGGSSQQPPIQSNGNTISRSLYSTTGTGINSINQVAVKVYSLAGGATSTIDLSAAIRNIVNDPTATFTRIKALEVILLTSTSTSGNYDATNGTLASSVTLGNSGANDWISQSGSTGLGSATSVFTIANGGMLAFSCDNAAGTVIDGTHKNLKLLNNDGAVTANIQITFIGADA